MQMGAAGAPSGPVWTDPDLANASYDGVSFSVTGNGADVYFKPDGTAFFSTDLGNKIYKYSMTTAWDLSTASSTGSSLSASGAFGLYFKTDGTRLFFIDNYNDSVNQVDLSTAWDLSTAGTVVAGAPNVGSIVRGIRFSSDGTKMYSSDRAFTRIEQFNLSTAWDISSSSASSSPNAVFNVSSQTTQPAIYAFNPDGTKMWVTDAGSDSIYEYSLSTAWSVSSASYSSISFGLGSQDATPIGGQFKPDGSKMYVLGYTNDTIYQYST
jgi:sugar lactone lactonase YvrE